MAHSWGNQSRACLDTCHPAWRAILDTALLSRDLKVVWGWRSEQQQNDMVRQGRSKAVWPKSYHNRTDSDGNPRSMAVDVCPYPQMWSSREELTLMAGMILAIAEHKYGVILTWGNDWDRDWSTLDNRFDDLAHFQIMSFLPGSDWRS